MWTSVLKESVPIVQCLVRAGRTEHVVVAGKLNPRAMLLARTILADSSNSTERPLGDIAIKLCSVGEVQGGTRCTSLCRADG